MNITLTSSIFSNAVRQVEFSLLSAIFVGACMIEGNIIDGFKETLENFLLNAVADIWHGYVVLFSLFLSYVHKIKLSFWELSI